MSWRPLEQGLSLKPQLLTGFQALHPPCTTHTSAHVSVWYALPAHCRPPYLGSGLLQNRRRLRVPPLHCLAHTVQESHAPHCPCTARIKTGVKGRATIVRWLRAVIGHGHLRRPPPHLIGSTRTMRRSQKTKPAQNRKSFASIHSQIVNSFHTLSVRPRSYNCYYSSCLTLYIKIIDSIVNTKYLEVYDRTQSHMLVIRLRLSVPYSNWNNKKACNFESFSNSYLLINLYKWMLNAIFILLLFSFCTFILLCKYSKDNWRRRCCLIAVLRYSADWIKCLWCTPTFACLTIKQF